MSHPRASRDALDSVVAFFLPARALVKLLPAYVTRAEAELAMGNGADAVADLDRAAALYDAERHTLSNVPERAALEERALSVFERLALVRLDRGDTIGALNAIERGRVGFEPATRLPRDEGLREQNADVTINYLLVGDTLLSWAVAHGSVHLQRSSDGVALRGLFERVRGTLERFAPLAIQQRELSALYDLLLRPFDAVLGADGSSVLIVANDELSSVPFAALFDRKRSRFVVEGHQLRFASSLREGRRPARVGRPSGALLIVADPAFDAREYPGLPRLPGAQAEARAIAPRYSNVMILSATGAHPAAVNAALLKASTVHFAAHALLDDERPDRSALILAVRHSGERSVLNAADIAQIDLHRVRLVILSGCETMRSPSSHSSGLRGLSTAFLAAGATGVIGSLWRIDDALTLPLMDAFHRSYSVTG